MTISRRRFVLAASATIPFMLGSGRASAEATTLKISHQFPGGTLTEGDFRDRLCQKFAIEIEKRSKGALKAQVYAGSSLMKTNAQFSAMRKGALDMSLYPLPYAGGEVQETNIGLMPGIIPSYEQAAKWKTGEIGKLLNTLLNEKGIVMVSWIFQAGGAASRSQPLVGPEDAKGMKVRGGSREMDMVLKEAGASVLAIPSNEIYAGMQTGAMDAALTSSTSLISFRLEELAKHLTTGRGQAYWFMCEPLMMSKQIFDALPKDQRDIIMAVGEEMEKFGTDAAKADDVAVATVYQKAGAKVYDLDAPTLKKWQDIARRTAWKEYAAKSETSAKILAAAEKLL
ncbi:MAG TPA: TRAP transporter substrate-binding protein DctP [Usitatibacter sp.]|nr:TRAP transporter substrate-binding protein DctP [Usitatibacter sp.]